MCILGEKDDSLVKQKGVVHRCFHPDKPKLPPTFNFSKFEKKELFFLKCYILCTGIWCSR